ncbi:MAG: hypothetical protein KME26_29945 [Oscillatoria princeps RMCB-10]|nr:hypothetical protein [Oscillatoria princeps RMCB-10]
MIRNRSRGFPHRRGSWALCDAGSVPVLFRPAIVTAFGRLSGGTGTVKVSADTRQLWGFYRRISKHRHAVCHIIAGGILGV